MADLGRRTAENELQGSGWWHTKSPWILVSEAPSPSVTISCLYICIIHENLLVDYEIHSSAFGTHGRGCEFIFPILVVCYCIDSTERAYKQIYLQGLLQQRLCASCWPARHHSAPRTDGPRTRADVNEGGGTFRCPVTLKLTAAHAS
jgi:hypothetical protein